MACEITIDSVEFRRASNPSESDQIIIKGKADVLELSFTNNCDKITSPHIETDGPVSLEKDRPWEVILNYGECECGDDFKIRVYPRGEDIDAENACVVEWEGPIYCPKCPIIEDIISIPPNRCLEENGERTAYRLVTYEAVLSDDDLDGITFHWFFTDDPAEDPIITSEPRVSREYYSPENHNVDVTLFLFRGNNCSRHHRKTIRLLGCATGRLELDRPWHRLPSEEDNGGGNPGGGTTDEPDPTPPSDDDEENCPWWNPRCWAIPWCLILGIILAIGIGVWLVTIAIGLEDTENIIETFGNALLNGPEFEVLNDSGAFASGILMTALVAYAALCGLCHLGRVMVAGSILGAIGIIFMLYITEGSCCEIRDLIAAAIVFVFMLIVGIVLIRRNC